MESLIIVCVLALGALTAGEIGLLIWFRSELSTQEAKLSAKFSVQVDTLTTFFEQLRRDYERLDKRVSHCEAGVKLTSNAHLAAELESLAATVEKISRSIRKQFGSVWAEIHADGVLKRNGEKQSTIPDLDVDDEVAAEIALQSAPVVRPGGA